MIMRTLFLFFIICFTGLDLSAEPPLAVYLTWQRDPATTMTVQWISKKDSSQDSIQYQRVEKDKWKNTEGTHKDMPQNEPYYVHYVELTDLRPDSTYRFHLPDSDHEYRFRTMPEQLTESLTFLAGGDTNQCGTEVFEETNRQAAKQEPAFVLFGGDLAYASPTERLENEDAQRWLDWIASYSRTMITPSGNLIPLLVTIGNHDIKGNNLGTPHDAPFFFTLFAMPNYPGYNVLRFGSYLSIFLLDTNHANPIKGKQTKWLSHELAKDSARNTLHRFAIYHVAAYPSVRRYSHGSAPSIRYYWVPLFEKHHLNVAFENNDHAYKRTYPLLNDVVHPQGIVYIGDGSWGTTPRVPKPAEASQFFAKTQSIRQFMKVKLTPTSREFWSITPSGTVIDHYVQFVQK